MMGPFFVRATALAVCFSLVLPAGFAQSPAEGDVRFRVQSNTVVVDVTVTDNKGNTIHGLTANDFRVTENGIEQKIIGLDPPPETTKGRGKSQPASTPNATVGGTGTMARVNLVTLALDLGDTQMRGLNDSIKALKDYVQKTITDDDYVALYAISTNLRLIVPYTRNKGRLLDEIAKLNKLSESGIFTTRDRDRSMNEIAKLQSDESGLRASGSSADKLMADMVLTERLTLMAQMSFQNAFQAKSVLRAMRAIAVGAGTLPGRKSVILFSEGFVHAEDSEDYVNAVISTANRANVTFYIVDPASMGQPRNFSGGSNADNQFNEAPAGAGMGRVPNSRGSQQAELARMGPQVIGGQTKFDLAKQAMSMDSKGSDMENIAYKTGGFLAKGGSPLTSLDRVDRDLREYYLLTYQASDVTLDGKFREIKVAVEGKHYQVRARKGYYAVPQGDDLRLTPAAAQMVASVAAGTAKPTIPIKLNSALVLERKIEHSVPFSVWLPNDTSWATKDPVGGYETQIVLVVTARNAAGQLIDAYQQTLDFKKSKEDWKSIEKFGLQLIASVSSPLMEPLDVEAIVSFTNGKIGLVNAKIGVPGRPEAGVRPTSLVLTSQIESAKKNAEPVIPALRLGDYDVIIPKDSQFAASGKLTVYFGLSNVTIDAASGRPLLGLALAIKNGDKVIKELPALDGLFPWPQSPTRLFFLKQYDLAGLPPGSYTMEATLKDRVKDTLLTQSAPFTVQ